MAATTFISHNVHLPLDSMGSRCSAWTMAVTQARPCGGFSLHDSSTETLTPQQLCVYSLRYYCRLVRGLLSYTLNAQTKSPLHHRSSGQSNWHLTAPWGSRQTFNNFNAIVQFRRNELNRWKLDK
ncbi:hypothetical protein VNO77_18631 [Canavalia gladiata]|uniref:Uncharacterized protein n=1 Tax=Canavalia gladiata TaxID=3824 RepID=A0AAN9LPM9_CANGL